MKYTCLNLVIIQHKIISIADGIQIWSRFPSFNVNFTGAERLFIRTDYPLKGDLSIPAPKPLPFEYFLTVLAWCETFDVDEG